jgi:hypothetical protein
VFVRYLEKNTWERSWFDEVIYLPFENRMIPAPAGFDGRLRAEYGDYMKPAKAPTMHGGADSGAGCVLCGVSERKNTAAEISSAAAQ